MENGMILRTPFGIEIPRTLEELTDPRYCALIVYDMQLGIVRQIPDGAQVTAAVKRLLDAARQAGMRIFFTRHLSLPRELMGAFQYRMAMAWQRLEDPAKVEPWFLRDSPGFPVVPELEPLASEAVFDKITMSAFEGTPLTIAMRDCGIRSFLICGIALEIGIDPTCRHGADLGLIPVLVKDACGAGHADAAERAVSNLGFLGDTFVTDLASIEASLRARR
jgi:biuret amidohydrolase